ncbi:SAM-dependent methyltransferase [soil metagenome]
MAADPTSAQAFEDRYRAAADPWDFGGSAYEQGRYDAICSALGRPRYDRAYETACSVGALTVRLADRCTHLRAVDVSPTAVAHAAERCAHLPHVDLAVASVADDPLKEHDLVVFSEIGYYFAVAELDRIIERLAASVAPDGELVACHWLGESVDHRLHGSLVHQRLHRLLRLDHVHHDTTPGFVLDVWRRQ